MAAVLREPSEGDVTFWLKKWIEIRAQNITQAKHQHGGWEGWLQVELSFYLATRYFHYRFLREQRVFVSQSKKIDLWLQHLEGHDDYPNIGVELKCETMAEKKGAFQARFVKDIEKVQDGPRTNLHPCRMYAIGITMDKEDLKGYGDVGGRVYYNLVAPKENIYMVWWEDSFH